MTETASHTDDFIRVIHLPLSPDAVVALFTSAAGVSRWWGPTVGDGDVGGVLSISFGGYGANAVRVLEAGPARVVWEPVVPAGRAPTGHTQEWLGTRVEFTVEPTPNGTELFFRHVGMTSALDCYHACVDSWTYFLAGIETLASTGTGTPFVAPGEARS